MAQFHHYVAYLRPRAFVPCWLCTLTGYALSPSRPESALEQLGDLAWLFSTYSVLLWGGTNALNSSQDRDEGPVNMLPNPPPLPPYLGLFGLAVMGLGIGLSALKGPRAVGLALVAVFLSIYYSVKLPGLGRRGKEVPGVDILINSIGFGLHAVLLGYSATPAPWALDVFWVGSAISVMCWGGIPTSQVFQLKPEDTVGTAHNFSAWLGPRRVLLLGPVFFMAHLVLLGLYTVLRQPEILRQPVPLVLWLGWLAALTAAALHSLWWARSPFQHSYQRMLRHMLFVLAGQTCWTAAAWVETSARN